MRLIILPTSQNSCESQIKVHFRNWNVGCGYIRWSPYEGLGVRGIHPRMKLSIPFPKPFPRVPASFHLIYLSPEILVPGT